MRRHVLRVIAAALVASLPIPAQMARQNRATPAQEAAMKADLIGQIDGMKKQAQVMNDSVFSFAELGFQEFETSKYLTAILEKEGFKIERGVAGIPTAFVATWGSGKPVIALGSDIDDIPQASQKPGVAYHAPMIDGAPGHGEGHNSGMPLNILAALAMKKVMEREHLQGTIKLWPGVAEEQLATKAYYVRAGVFKDATLYCSRMWLRISAFPLGRPSTVRA
jgi:aminobenzoyl-glutamate utilization protein B